MITLDHAQGTEEWLLARCGIPTASNFDKIVTTKGEPSKQAQKYLYQLAGERVSGYRDEGFTSAAMQRGVELESEARSFYELTREVEIQSVGLCFPDDSKKYGCSPDGLIGADGLIEIKCPLISTHVGYLVDGGLPSDYFQQVQGQLLVTNRDYCDFVSYFPGLKPLVVRVERDFPFLKKLKEALEVFCADLEKTVEKIK